MADPWVASEFAAEAQDYIDASSIASNHYYRSPFLSWLGELTIGNHKKHSLEIGRPDSAAVLGGSDLDPADHKSLQGVNTYRPRVQTFKTTNSTFRTTPFGTTTQVANIETRSHAQAALAEPGFNWCAQDTPIWIWEEHLIRAAQANEGNDTGAGIAYSQLVREATEVATQDHIDAKLTAVFEGNPADQTAMLWSAPLGIVQAADNDNTYAQVDRTNPNALTWRSQVDTTLTSTDVVAIVNDIHYTKKLNTLGTGAKGYLCMCPSPIYILIKQQILGMRSVGVVMPSGSALPEMAKGGVTAEFCRYEDCYFCHEPFMNNPDTSSAYTNTIFVTDPSTWIVINHPKFKNKISDFTKQATIYGGMRGEFAEINDRYILANRNPYRMIRYTAINT